MQSFCRGLRSMRMVTSKILPAHSHVNATVNVVPLKGETLLETVKSRHVWHTVPVRYSSTTVQPEDSITDNSSESTSGLTPYVKFKRLDKTARNIMQILDKEAVEKVKSDREILDIQPGYIVQLKVEVPENKRRVSTMKGIVIARRNAGLNTTIRLRRLVAGVGVESVLPLYSPNIKEMKILEKKKVRRAKLYYLRNQMNALNK